MCHPGLVTGTFSFVKTEGREDDRLTTHAGPPAPRCRPDSAAALCSITSFAPQGYKIWRERDASAVSLKTYSLTVTCFALWVVYGVMTQAWPVTAANSCALAMAACVLAMKWRFRDGDPEAKEGT